ERGFEFTGCNIEKTEQKNGEIWLFVSPGVKFITIRHRDFGSIINYPFPESIKSGNSYELKLTTARIRQIVEEQIQNQYLVIRSNTPDAKIFIDEEFVDRNQAKKLLSLYEDHTYRVEAPLYHSKEGVVRLNENEKTELQVDLEPAFGYLKITTKPESGAEIEINGKLIEGKTPLTSDKLPSGNYTIQAFKPMYKSTPQEVQLREGETLEVSIDLIPTFANTEIICQDKDADIYIDEQFKAKGVFKDVLTQGKYRLKVVKPSHRTFSKEIDIVSGKPFVEKVPNLEPIYGKLNIDSNPFDADIYIDGKSYGKTPNQISKVLIGQHSLSLKKEGYAELQATIEIAEGKISTYNFTMQQQKKQEKQEKQTLASDVETFRVKGVEFKMIKVEGGTFSMGATSEQGSDARYNEKPVHSVTLSDYYIGETEVTQELWEAVMGSNPSHYKGNNQRPVEFVSWNDCQEFIKKLNQLTGKKFRLPTEAEWEYAARGGKYSRGYKYSGSNNADEVAWYWRNSGDKYLSGKLNTDTYYENNCKMHPVKTKKANELGLYDMSGNVWEWCNDRYGDYQSNSQTNPTGPSEGKYRVYRGGGWNYFDGGVRVSSRVRGHPLEIGFGDHGLRLAL
ncbi:MAG: SUMF1/EgtB/PvdO family nonheme iron enzyme, partial [Candidatus Onthomorpha sp.]|nr:SUMF1/EgtB/PvdO family nonheme iron enzyme [Candidatus Onthomorpha sp.]